MFEFLKDPIFSNLLSGLVGSIVGFIAAVFIAFLQSRWNRKAAEKQRQHEVELFEKQKNHDKSMFDQQVRQDRDMQRRQSNIDKNGYASLREIGGG